MTVLEQHVSLPRHHAVVERETELLRAAVKSFQAKIKAVKRMFPTIDLGLDPEVPPETSKWRPRTYRNGSGDWPSGIKKHEDWLREEDYRQHHDEALLWRIISDVLLGAKVNVVPTDQMHYLRKVGEF